MQTTPLPRNLGIYIPRSYTEVYDFLARPENLPRWAAGLAQGIEPAPDSGTNANANVNSGQSTWLIHTQAGVIKMVFAARNDYCVADHTVYPPDGSEVYVPMRVVRHGDGSTVILTLFRQPGMSDADYERDTQLVQQDLQRLRSVLTAD